MNGSALASGTRTWLASYVAAWDRFWFTPRLPHTLGLLRVITGAFLLYSHLVLATDLGSFLGDNAWINNETARALHDGTFGSSDMARSYLWLISNPLLIWLHQGLTILITAAFMIGFMTRITAPAAWFLQVMYLHRMTGALFGFDQIVTYATMYLMISPCGSCFSVDARLCRWFAEQRATNKKIEWLLPQAVPSISANIATRLLQLHLCVIYLFGGLAKARGETWWDGTAMWYSVGNYEYQSIDMTWISRFPKLFTAMSHATMFWEIFYCAIIWPKWSRPIALAIAVAAHGGIALFLGMKTFGMMMIAANGIFIEPETLRRWLRMDVGSEETALPETNQSSENLVAQRAILTPAEKTQREAELNKREQQVESAARRLRARRTKQKEREAKYRERVSALKEREAKIKDLIERQRARKNKDEPT